MSRESHALRMASALFALASAICLDSKVSSGWLDDDLESFSSTDETDICDERPSRWSTLDELIVREKQLGLRCVGQDKATI